jgi:hypothetical protein
MKFAFVALVGLVAIGCQRSKPATAAPAIVEVRVIDRGVGEGPPLDVAALTARAADAIAKASGLPVTDGGVAAGKRYKLLVEVRAVGSEDPGSTKGVLHAYVNARLSPVGELGGLSFEQSAVAEKSYDVRAMFDLAAAWRAHSLRAVEDVVRGVGARARLSTGDAAAIAAALDGSDEDLRAEAERLAGERRERAAVPSLVRLLKSEDHETRDRAIGALAAIGDRRAVRPLTEVARFRDLSDLPKVLDALASIGGDEARSYLEFVASGHDSAEIRDLAKQALTHLERHASDAAVATQ